MLAWQGLNSAEKKPGAILNGFRISFLSSSRSAHSGLRLQVFVTHLNHKTLRNKTEPQHHDRPKQKISAHIFINQRYSHRSRTCGRDTPTNHTKHTHAVGTTSKLTVT